MKPMGTILRIFIIATLLLSQAGCAMIAGQVAMAGGKKVYQKMQDDKAEKEQAKQE
jgi:hypothetical protein